MVFILKKNPTECVIHLWFSPDSKGSLYVMATISQSDDLDIARVCDSALVGVVKVRQLECLTFEPESVYGTRAPIQGMWGSTA